MENRLKADFSKSAVWCLLQIVMQGRSILGKFINTLTLYGLGSKQWKSIACSAADTVVAQIS